MRDKRRSGRDQSGAIQARDDGLIARVVAEELVKSTQSGYALELKSHRT